MEENTTLLSVCMITFNHENYLKTAINSIVTQNVDFNFELIIGADNPSEKVLSICNEFFHLENPNVILLDSKEQHGMINNFFRTINACSGKYITICEGDDYWTDPYKLQKQVDFLEMNPEYGMIASDINLINEKGDAIPDNAMVLLQREKRKPEPNVFDLLQINTINTLTTCIRAELIKELTRTAQENGLWFVYDYWFWLNSSLDNRIKLLYDKTASYRVHNEGISRKKGFLDTRKHLIHFDIVKKIYHDPKFSNINKNNWQILAKIYYNLFSSPHLKINNKLTLMGYLMARPSLFVSFFSFFFGLIIGKLKGGKNKKTNNPEVE
ncbi:MAG: hypothetical protein CVT95_09855 [Bacteroidetes bacterium HGW-Bacteroidetes-12]|nr:MAG: hypothetical protein CVT95_09855 [Bacteroidetes bacterium HGW-Bacteroidetes-12]